MDYETDWSMLEEGPGLEQSVVIPNAVSKSDITHGELGICCFQGDSTTQLSLGFIWTWIEFRVEDDKNFSRS